MLDQHDRLSMTSGMSTQPGEPVVWNFVDNDTRKWVCFEGPFDAYYEEEEGFERAYDAFLNSIDVLDHYPKITKLVFSAEGQLLRYSTSAQDDITPVVHYPFFDYRDLKVAKHQLIKRSRIIELDRLQPALDLVQEQSHDTELVFKYDFAGLPDTLQELWHDAFVVQRLSGHPNIVPFCQFVVDDRLLGFLGYTMKYIPGGSLDDIQKHRPTIVKRKWMTELMKTIDDLDLHYGIMHQDIALRNILLDRQMDRPYLCDFGSVARIGSQDMPTDPAKDDGKMLVFSIHHLLTGDKQYFQKHPSLIDINSIVSQNKWPLSPNVRLEPGVTADQLRAEILGWYEKRMRRNHDTPIKARQPLQWPPLPKMSMYETVRRTRSETKSVNNHFASSPARSRWKSRRNQLGPSEYIVDWERPSSKVMMSRRSGTDTSRRSTSSHK